MSEECYVCYNETWIKGECGHYICFNCLRSGYEIFIENGCGLCRGNIKNLLQCDIEVNKPLFRLIEARYKVKIGIYKESHWHICTSCECNKHDEEKDQYACVNCPGDDINCLCSGLENMVLFSEIGIATYFLREIKKRKNIVTVTINSGDLSDRFEGITRDVISYNCCGQTEAELEFKICYTCLKFQPHTNIENMCLQCIG